MLNNLCKNLMLQITHYPIFNPIPWLSSFFFRCYLRSDRNSSRVRWSDRNSPSMVEVVVLELIFCTPRITMHMCLKSFTRIIILIGSCLKIGQHSIFVNIGKIKNNTRILDTLFTEDFTDIMVNIFIIIIIIGNLRN